MSVYPTAGDVALVKVACLGFPHRNVSVSPLVINEGILEVDTLGLEDSGKTCLPFTSLDTS